MRFDFHSACSPRIPHAVDAPRNLILKGSAWLTLGLSALFLYFNAVATAQSACAQLGVNCHPSYSGSYHPYYNPAMAAYYRQMRAQQALQRRENKGHAKNEAGVAAYNRGDYKSALKYFRKAHSYWPENSTIYQNLQNAQNQYSWQLLAQRQRKLALKQARQAAKLQAQKDKAAAKLRSQQQKQQEAEARRLAKLHPATNSTGGQVSSSAFFGTSSNPAHPGLQALPPAGPGPGTNAMDQLKAMAGTSNTAAHAGTDEAASHSASATPDRGEGNPGDAPIIVGASTPSAKPVLSPEVQQKLAKDADYQRLDSDRAQANQAASSAQQRLNTLQTQIQSESDPIKKQQLQIQVSDTTQQLETAKSQVRTDEIQQNDIVVKYEQGAPIILPAKPASGAQPGAATGASASSAPANKQGTN